MTTRQMLKSGIDCFLAVRKQRRRAKPGSKMHKHWLGHERQALRDIDKWTDRQDVELAREQARDVARMERLSIQRAEVSET